MQTIDDLRECNARQAELITELRYIGGQKDMRIAGLVDALDRARAAQPIHDKFEQAEKAFKNGKS